jgi:lysophospholipase L1-like esterase
MSVDSVADPVMNQPSSSFKDKLAKSGPRKLLALDGGGIRGIISVEILARIEKNCLPSAARPDLVRGRPERGLAAGE